MRLAWSRPGGLTGVVAKIAHGACLYRVGCALHRDQLLAVEVTADGHRLQRQRPRRTDAYLAAMTSAMQHGSPHPAWPSHRADVAPKAAVQCVQDGDGRLLCDELAAGAAGILPVGTTQMARLRNQRRAAQMRRGYEGLVGRMGGVLAAVSASSQSSPGRPGATGLWVLRVGGRPVTGAAAPVTGLPVRRPVAYAPYPVPQQLPLTQEPHLHQLPSRVSPAPRSSRAPRGSRPQADRPLRNSRLSAR